MPDTRLPHLPDGDLDVIVARFGLADIRDIAYLSSGLMNRNWRITTDRNRYALKQIIDVPLATARRNLHVLAALTPRGLPACRPLLTIDGDPVIEIHDRGYCLLPWLDGNHPAGPDLTMDHACELGTALGRIHEVLNRLGASAGLPTASTRPAARVIDPTAAISEANRYLAAAQADQGSPFDLAVIELLHHRKTLIDKYSPDRPADESPRGPFGWTHGDVPYRNVIWHNGHVAAVIDWDRIRVRPFAEEVARTATIQFGSHHGLDLTRLAAFVTGYRTVVPIAIDDLADGAHRPWWKRLSDFWHLDFHYDRGDHGCDDLFLSGEALLDWWTDNRDAVQDAFAAQP